MFKILMNDENNNDKILIKYYRILKHFNKHEFHSCEIKSLFQKQRLVEMALNTVEIELLTKILIKDYK